MIARPHPTDLELRRLRDRLAFQVQRALFWTLWGLVIIPGDFLIAGLEAAADAWREGRDTIAEARRASKERTKP